MPDGYAKMTQYGSILLITWVVEMVQTSVRHGLVICLLLPFAGCESDDAPASPGAEIAIAAAEKAAAEKAAAEKAAAEKAAAEKAAAEKAAAEKAAAEAAEKDPVKQFEKIATSVNDRRTVLIRKPDKALGSVLESARFWGKIDSRVVSVLIDVKKTDSLVTTLVGTITIRAEEIDFGLFETEAEARAASIPTDKGPQELIYHFGWQNNKWVFKSGLKKDLLGVLRQTGDDRPGWPLKELDWPFAPIKKSGQGGRYDNTIVVFDE
jgi:hypothetical protein